MSFDLKEEVKHLIERVGVPKVEVFRVEEEAAEVKERVGNLKDGM
ncbi:MAG TPA: hypothetical protein VF432_25200 [Thermoanaerobaculia bacterium]